MPDITPQGRTPRPETPGQGDRAQAPYPGDRRRSHWGEFRHAYPGIVATMAIALVALLAMNGWLFVKRHRYQAEIARLRGGMSDVERRRTDIELRADESRLKVQLELFRRQARVDKALHLSVSVDSAVMYLEQGAAQLRVMPVQVGAERWVTASGGPDSIKLAAPRGQRTVERILTGKAPWEVPRWVWQQRGLEAPAARTIEGALGPVAIVLSGGTVIYSLPTVGPLNDSAYVLPGSLRAREADLRAVLPNLKSGQAVYFY